MKPEAIQPHLLYNFKSEAELVKAVQEISMKFTRERDSISDYLNDSRLVSAYTFFYLLTNIPKLEAVLKWMPTHWVEEILACDLVDLGSGPGTFSLAWKELGGKGDVYQVETAKLMKEQGLKIWQGLYQDKLYQSHRWEWKTQNPKVLIFGHSANEMGVEKTLRYIEEINPEHILFIEPGTKDFFPQMLSIRDQLLSDDFNVLYPCPGPKECPMRNDGANWCHQFIHVKQDPEIERISQMVKLDRKLLPLTVHAYSRSFKWNNPSERIVRVLPETKFSFEWDVCHHNELQHYQVMKKDFSKQEAKAIGSLLSGEGIVTELIKNVEKTRRVKLQKVVKP